MTIDSSFISCFKSVVPAAFSDEIPFIPQAVFIDGQIKLMGPQQMYRPATGTSPLPPEQHKVVTWEEYVDRQFTYSINRQFSLGVECVILAFDNYDHVPSSKSMTQTSRRKNIPKVHMHDEDSLPQVVPMGEHWTQLMANRTFKTKLIQMIVGVIARRVKMLQDSQSLIVDFQGAPVRYNWEGNQTEVLSCFPPLGEADVKFVRYTSLYPKLRVDSVDGDNIPIALLHFETGFKGMICIYRMKTAGSLPVKRKIQFVEGEGENASADPSLVARKRMYEYVDVGLLFQNLKRQIVPRNGPYHRNHPGHEISMLVAMIGLAGTDFTRGLPQLSGKTLFESIPCIWSKIALSYDPVKGQLDPDKALDNIVCTLYRMKFNKHVSSYKLAGVLTEISQSGLAERTKASIPKHTDVFHCTIRNINWLLLYWRDKGIYPDPIDPLFGYVRTPTGGVKFAA